MGNIVFALENYNKDLLNNYYVIYGNRKTIEFNEEKPFGLYSEMKITISKTFFVKYLRNPIWEIATMYVWTLQIGF